MKQHDHQVDEFFMRRAFELARLGQGYVSPNPMVGCVIVCNNTVVGEGWHKKQGTAHAEVNAIYSVADKAILKESTLYVSLEPCNHTGSTPPCTESIIANQIKKVVISNVDPNPLVKGGGIQKLREAGIEVITGILESEGKELNRRFFTYSELRRPFILLKWAQTSDGFIAKANYDSKWISNEHSRQLVHKWRSEEDAVLVGMKTVFHDNPQLNVRDWTGKNPVRIVIDRFLKLSDKLQFFDRSQPTIVYNLMKHEEHENLKLIRLSEEDFLKDLLHDLYQQKIQSLIVEGGAQTLQLFIDAGLWDEVRVFTSEKQFGAGIRAPYLHGNLILTESVFNDTLSYYKPVYGKN
jgi:diaminohydroxyphosphoribosylaminopyrimidine deaminase / 5-amino-6-(5-phosphoribosylamino)uracil reductase